MPPSLYAGSVKVKADNDSMDTGGWSMLKDRVNTRARVPDWISLRSVNRYRP
jgi:hypothetical protein